MKFKFYNDTGRVANVHPATFIHGCEGKQDPIKPMEERFFLLPTGSYPMIKMWDYGEERGLQLLASPIMEEDE